MSDQAWASLIASDEYNLEDIERMLSHYTNMPSDFDQFWLDVRQGKEIVHPRYFTGIDFTRNQPSRAEAYECWKTNLWKQAVLHGETKARLGLETHWLLYFIRGMNLHSQMIGNSFVGFMPCFITCNCCWQKPVLVDEENYPQFIQCEACIAAGHEPGEGMAHRWHDCFGYWWVEHRQDNGPDYLPSHWVLWRDDNAEGETVARAAAKKARAEYPPEDKIFVYSPAGEGEEITA